MPTQKLFKQRVRARMAKTGEAYTTARLQLLRRAEVPDDVQPDLAPHAAPEAVSASPAGSATNLVSEASMVRATGHGHDHWFALLDAWGATGHTHTEIARWVNATHGVAGWWSQNITVAYERARGMRGAGQMADGYSVTVTRTLAADPERILEAFTDGPIRERWLPEPLTPRPTKAARTRRFDWADPPSRVAVTVTPKGGGRHVVGVDHDRLPDAATADAMKARWRDRLGALQRFLEA